MFPAVVSKVRSPSRERGSEEIPAGAKRRCAHQIVQEAPHAEMNTKSTRNQQHKAIIS